MRHSLALIVVVAALAGCADDANEYHAYSPPIVEQGPTLADAESVAAKQPLDAAESGGLLSVIAGSRSEDLSDLIIEHPVSIDPGLSAPGTTTEFALAVARDPEAALLAAAAVPQPLPTFSEEPREIKLLVPENEFRVEGPEGAVRLGYDDLDLLKVLNMDPVTPDAPDHFPEWLAGLEGRRIRLRGYMRPGLLTEDIPTFVLARDTKCCFGPNTNPYDIIPINLRAGVTTDYIYARPFDVVGVFHVDVIMHPDKEEEVWLIYYVDDAVVIEN